MTPLELWLSLGTVFLCLILSAFFSGSETGLTTASRARLRMLEREGNKRALRVAHLHKNKEQLLGSLLIGNNIVNIGASALTTAVALQLFGAEGVAIATAIITILVIIFSELLPKTYAIRHSERVALFAAPIMSFFVWLFTPLTAIVYTIVRVILRIFGATGPVNSLTSAHDALRGAIDLHHEEGEMEKDDKDMLGGILDLSDRTVYDAMVHRKNMQTLNIDLPPEQIVAAIIASPHTRIPLWQGNPDNIVGVLHAKDLLRAISEAPPTQLHLRQILRKPWFIPATTNLDDQLHAFRKRRNHFGVVVDEYGALEGIITLEDILEEIVGEIDDEHDEFTSDIIPQLDGSAIVEGEVSIRDINRELDWGLPDDHAATVAGLLLHEAREIPDIGARYEYHGYRFEVLDKEKNQITRLRIEKLPDTTAGENI